MLQDNMQLLLQIQCINTVYIYKLGKDNEFVVSLDYNLII